MVKLGKNKLKLLNKITKNRNAVSSNTSNKVLKKKINLEKKVTFHKEVLLREVTSGNNDLVKNISKKEILLKGLPKKTEKPKQPKQTQEPKLKPVQKQKKRQETQISDTKLLLNLIKRSKIAD